LPLAGETHPGVDAGHQPIGFLSPVVAHQQPASATGRIGHVCAPLQDQIQAGAKVIPPFLQRRDPGVADADFKGDDAQPKVLPAARAPLSSHSI
jgi:hypothetical protein